MIPSIEGTIVNLEEPIMPLSGVVVALSASSKTERISIADLLKEASSQLQALESADAAARRKEIFGEE